VKKNVELLGGRLWVESEVGGHVPLSTKACHGAAKAGIAPLIVE